MPTVMPNEDAMVHLRAEHPAWRIWRSVDHHGDPAGWVATRRVDDDVEPVIHADTAAALQKRLESPCRRYGRSLSAAQRDAILARLGSP